MLAEYVPPDFDAQQRQTAEEALAIIARESGADDAHIAVVTRQGGIYHEVLEEAKTYHADLIVMSRTARPCAPISSAPTPATWCALRPARCSWCGIRTSA